MSDSYYTRACLCHFGIALRYSKPIFERIKTLDNNLGIYGSLVLFKKSKYVWIYKQVYTCIDRSFYSNLANCLQEYNILKV